jgi:hypothetical protein
MRTTADTMRPTAATRRVTRIVALSLVALFVVIFALLAVAS